MIFVSLDDFQVSLDDFPRASPLPPSPEGAK